MFSGKTDWLIDRFEAASSSYAAIAFTAPTDTRLRGGTIRSHSGRAMPCNAMRTPDDIERLDPGVVAVVDEVQFFSEKIVHALIGHARIATVFAAGLDHDFARRPFEMTAALVCAADEVVPMVAVCSRCGGVAALTQRYANGCPAPLDSRRILVGDEETYQPRCERCWLAERAEIPA